MIDFETATVPIPFNKGRHPYEQIAFQFSHHVVHEDHTVEHAGEYLNSTPGVFPNFDFVRALRDSLGDSGTIFCYSHHENTVLCQIREQLLSSEGPVQDELISFIESITIKKQGSKILWEGPRNMVDLCDMVKKYYYHPLTQGSNSLKYVLPAIIQDSSSIREKYSRPIYGTEIKSKNFSAHAWIQKAEEGEIRDPYRTLPKIFEKWDSQDFELEMSNNDIQNGGAAMTAYAMMQFSYMDEREREKIREALLRYCELDTFAMVLIWEYWDNLINPQ